MEYALILIVYLFFLEMACIAPAVINLNGNDWTVQNKIGNYVLNATVPGDIYSDLVAAGALQQPPYYRFNDVDYRWVSKEDWTYSKTFKVDAETLSNNAVFDLDCGGIDTVASIYINKQLAGQTESQHVRYVFGIKPYLKAGDNTIEVQFQSPVNYVKDTSTAYPYDVPPNCPPQVQNGECHPNFIRKMQASFSWDWGPAFPTMGIWRNITIKAYNTAIIDYITVYTEPVVHGDWVQWYVKGNIHFRKNPALKSIDGALTYNIFGLYIQSDSVTLNDTVTEHSYSLLTDRTWPPSPWMPRGHGTQWIYQMEVTFSPTTPYEKPSSKTINFGFRTVELVEEPVQGSPGLSFYFKINGVPIFMKGSNWIPADSFQTRITPDYLRILLESAAEANMNMLRVWGGGVYESEKFYEICDELGIMIWQDFMFACSMYPTDQKFLDNVKEEITHQVRRLSRHPSIALWAGNNENEGALASNWYNTNKNYSLYYNDYIKLYIDTIKPVVEAEDPSRPYVPSSPSNGKETEQNGWVAKNPQDEYYGDVHHYDYTSDNWDWTIYPIPRFASEFGFQSWTSISGLRPVSNFTDLDWDSKFAQHRQHHGDGNEEMKGEYEVHFTPPPPTPNPAYNFENQIYLSQINQAMGIKTEAELHRRMQNLLYGDRGCTYGSLYWQLNDIWQAPTWASMEYGGKWKMLHYFAAQFYNQTLLSPVLENNTLRVYYVDDRVFQLHTEQCDDTALKFEPYSGGEQKKKSLVAEKINEILKEDMGTAKEQDVDDQITVDNEVLKGTSQCTEKQEMTLYYSMYRWDSMKPIFDWTMNFWKPNQPSYVILEQDLDSLMKQSGCPDRDSCFIHFSLDPDFSGPSNFLLLSYFKTAKGITKPNIKISDVHLIDNSTVTMKVSTDQITPFLWLDAGDISGRFSENGFIMIQPEKEIQFKYWKPEASVDLFMKQLTYKSLADLYSP